MPNVSEILAALYKLIGVPYPRASLAVITILGALAGSVIACALWITAAAQYAKTEKTVLPTHVSGPASTSGDNSPAVTGDGNQIDYGKSPEPKPKGKP
jgi:hypothetical protein